MDFTNNLNIKKPIYYNGDDTHIVFPNIDIKYGPWKSKWEALSLTKELVDDDGFYVCQRAIGLTVGIYAYGPDKTVYDELPAGLSDATPTSIVEYWFKDDIADENLVPKIPDVSGLPDGLKVVKFDANEGIGHMNSAITDEEGFIRLPFNRFERAGYEFKGWSLDANAVHTVAHDPDACIQVNGNVKFYAIWGATENNYTFYYFGMVPDVADRRTLPVELSGWNGVESTDAGFVVSGNNTLGLVNYVLIPSELAKRATRVTMSWMNEVSEVGEQELEFMKVEENVIASDDHVSYDKYRCETITMVPDETVRINITYQQ